MYFISSIGLFLVSRLVYLVYWVFKYTKMLQCYFVNFSAFRPGLIFPTQR